MHRDPGCPANKFPAQGVLNKPGTAAFPAYGIFSVMRQHHPDMHLVRARFQPVKKGANAPPEPGVKSPFALPDPPPLFVCKLVPRHVYRYPGGFSAAHQIPLAFNKRLSLKRLHTSGGNRFCSVRNHKPFGNRYHAPKPAAIRTCTQRGIERKQIRRRGLKNPSAVRARQLGGKTLNTAVSTLRNVRENGHRSPLAALQSSFKGFRHAQPVSV